MKRTQYFLFVPGYYGTSLVEPDSGELLWVNLREILIGHRTLTLPIPGLEIPGAMELKTKDLVERIPIAGPLYSISAYFDTMNLLRSLAPDNPKCVVSVPYDWRKDPLEAARRIDRAVKQIRSREPDAEVTLISHSFGSAVSAYYLRYGTQDYFEAKETWEGLHQFNKVVMSAAPFRGILPMFRNMNHGLKAGLNSNLLSGLAYSSFPSSYFFLPPEEYDIVLTHDLKEVQIPLWDPEQWWLNEWGLFHERIGLKEQNLPAMKRFVRKWLSRAHKFHELNMAPLSKFPSATPILYLQGTGNRTAHRGIWIKSESDDFLFYEWDFLKWKHILSSVNGHLLFTDGDSTVPAVSSELPSAFEEIGTHVLKANLGHLEILQDPSSQNEVRNFLNQ